MEEMTLFISLVLITSGILQIILFFKVWGMTNNVKEIKENKPDFYNRAVNAYYLGKKEECVTCLRAYAICKLSNLAFDDSHLQEYNKIKNDVTAVCEKLGIEPVDLSEFENQDEFRGKLKLSYK